MSAKPFFDLFQNSSSPFQQVTTRNSNSCMLLYSKWKTRGSRPEVFRQKGVLKYFAKFTGKDLWQSLFLNKVAGLSTVFFSAISKNTFLYRTLPVAASKRCRFFYKIARGNDADTANDCQVMSCSLVGKDLNRNKHLKLNLENTLLIAASSCQNNFCFFQNKLRA